MKMIVYSESYVRREMSISVCEIQHKKSSKLRRTGDALGSDLD